MAEGGPNDPTKPYLVSVKTDQPTIHDFWHHPSDAFTLPFHDPLAIKRRYPRSWTVLPYELANLPCDTITPHILLTWLNTIFDTNLTLSSRADVCLSEFIHDGCDLGTIYGYVRPWWNGIKPAGGLETFDSLRSGIRNQMQDDYKLRTEAMVGNHITKSDIPPRRVWDLYANRVLPYHAIRPEKSCGTGPHGTITYLPRNLWSVSHSWRPSSERQSVLTTINGKAWRVPIPKGTTLNAIREELLILGAEYVFLDVLCLRQKDELLPEMEGIRKKEWRLDIPTIGNIYNSNRDERPVVVYFNGLGLPFQDGPLDPSDNFHWFNRVWTLQETPRKIIFGGLQHKQGVVNFQDPRTQVEGVSGVILDQLRKSSETSGDIAILINAISSRTCSNPVDEVACLAYLLYCHKLPIYDADMSAEVAWSLLVECMSDRQRITLLRCNSHVPGSKPSFSWRPTWEQVKAWGKTSLARTPPPFAMTGMLQYLDGSSPSAGYKHGFDAYYHNPPVIEGCYIQISPSDGDKRSACVHIPSADTATHYWTFEVTSWGQSNLIKPNVPYLLVCASQSSECVVAQAVGSRGIDGARRVEVSKISIIEVPGTFGLPLIEPLSLLTWNPSHADFGSRWYEVQKAVKVSYQLVVWR